MERLIGGEETAQFENLRAELNSLAYAFEDNRVENVQMPRENDGSTVPIENIWRSVNLEPSTRKIIDTLLLTGRRSYPSDPTARHGKHSGICAM